VQNTIFAENEKTLGRQRCFQQLVLEQLVSEQLNQKLLVVEGTRWRSTLRGLKAECQLF
jgi:hypothetical protein